MLSKTPLGLESFDLEKYTNQATLSVQKWIPLIESRLFLKSLISGTAKQRSLNKDEVIEIGFKDFAHSLLDRILDNPLLPFEEKILSLIRPSWNQSNVSSISENQIFHFYRAVLENNKHYLVEHSDPITNGPISIPTFSHEVGDLSGPLDDALRGSSFYNLPHLVNYSIDIRGDTNKIIADFKKKLNADKKKYKVANYSVTDSRLMKWCEHQVLAYSDLRLWSQLSGHTLSDNLVQTLLQQKVMTRQQETVSKYYDDAISVSTLIELARTLK